MLLAISASINHVGNGKIMGSDIKNFTAHPYRRVELVAQLSGGADLAQAVALLKAAVAKVPNTTADPGVDVEILEFTEFGPKLAVRPYCHTQHYWQVYFDTNRVIADTLGTAGFPAAARPALPTASAAAGWNSPPWPPVRPPGSTPASICAAPVTNSPAGYTPSPATTGTT